MGGGDLSDHRLVGVAGCVIMVCIGEYVVGSIRGEFSWVVR